MSNFSIRVPIHGQNGWSTEQRLYSGTAFRIDDDIPTAAPECQHELSPERLINDARRILVQYRMAQAAFLFGAPMRMITRVAIRVSIPVSIAVGSLIGAVSGLANLLCGGRFRNGYVAGFKISAPLTMLLIIVPPAVGVIVAEGFGALIGLGVYKAITAYQVRRVPNPT